MYLKTKAKTCGHQTSKEGLAITSTLEVPMVETAKWNCIILCPQVLSSKHVFIVLREQYGVSMGSVVDLIEL